MMASVIPDNPPGWATQRPACADDAGSWCARVYEWSSNDFLSRIADEVVNKGLTILLIVVIAVLARALIHRAIRRTVQGAANGKVPTVLRRRVPAGRAVSMSLLSERRAQRANTIGSVLRSVASAIVGIVAVIMVLAEFGLHLGPILASAGIVGIALGFGAQNLVRDFLSGMFMLLEDQYGVGDVVDLGEAIGTVEAVGLRITTVRDINGTVWHVRNGEILRVGNMSQGYAVALVDLPLAHNADSAQAAEIAARVAAEVVTEPHVSADVLEPPEVLGVDTVTNEGMMLRITVKVLPGKQFGVRRALNAAITDAFEDAGVPRPYLLRPTATQNERP